MIKAVAVKRCPMVVADYGAVWGIINGNKIQISEAWYTRFPDGTLKVFKSKRDVTRAAKSYFKKNRVVVGKIEWRT